jgi:hypothetical protein
VHDLSRTPVVWDRSVPEKPTRVPASDIK